MYDTNCTDMSVGLKMLPTLAQPDLDNFHKIKLKKKLNFGYQMGVCYLPY